MKYVYFFYASFFMAGLAQAYPLNDELYILNQSKNTLEIKYSICYYRMVDGKSSALCTRGNTMILSPHQSQALYINSNDNHKSDARNSYYRYIYIYEVLSPSSYGFFLIDTDDAKQFESDYKNISTKPSVKYCMAGGVIGKNLVLDDFGTDRIYCM